MPDGERLIERLKRVRPGPVGLALIGLLGAGGIGGGGFYAYQAYDYVQHDNEFCMSCHLMQDPYERFAESAHRGLGCKACHQPSMVERTQMAMTQVIEEPEEISVHAEVPNERCISCHVEGDPDRWRSVAQSAGHRVHLESADSVLADLSCVECHSTSVHQFAPVTDTCAQSGCHTDNTVQLGGMSDLTIHCVACHSFSAPIDPVTTAELASLALDPGGSECLSCHVMRTLAQMPENDPHEQQCSLCHNPHTQDEPADAVQTCAIGGCHDDTDALTPFHRGLHVETLEDCTSCHSAHDFSLTGDNCLTCHQDVFDTPGTTFDAGRRIGATPSATMELATVRPAAGTMAIATAHGPLRGYAPTVDRERDGIRSGGPSASPWSGGDGEVTEWVERAPRHASTPVQRDTVMFRHDQHRDVDCMECHSTAEAHGGITVTSVADCRSCHHAAPVADDCSSCHAGGSQFQPPSDLYRAHTMDFEVKGPEVRELPFDHEVHADEACTSCHVDPDGGTLPADGVSCASCHEDHHDATAGVTCRSCHVPAPLEQHPVSEVHVTCSDGACHAESTLDDIPRVREFCLGCHQDMVDHQQEDGRPCAACHTLPAPRNSGG